MELMTSLAADLPLPMSPLRRSATLQPARPGGARRATSRVEVCHHVPAGPLPELRYATMDEGSIKTPNPKCRLYWCLIEFIDRRYSQSCWYFRPLLWTSAPLTFYRTSPTFPHFPKYTNSVWQRGGRVVLSCVIDYILQMFNTLFADQIQNLRNCYTTPNKNTSEDDL